MEHRALVRLAADNAAATYAAIAAGLKGSTVAWGDDWLSAHGPMPHTACNFAMALDSSKVAEALAFVKEDRGRLLYTFTSGMDPAHDPDVRRVHRLSVMIEESAPVAHPLPEIAAAHADRSVIAKFMALQFFHNLSRESRTQIADATATAEGLELVAFHRPQHQRIIGALMLSRTSGMLGLYNLCVDSNERDRGIGRRMVRHVSHLAAIEGLRVTLQCDPPLVPWYRDQGFRELAELNVWAANA